MDASTDDDEMMDEDASRGAASVLPSAVFAPIVSIATPEPRIHALRCLTPEPSTRDRADDHDAWRTRLWWDPESFRATLRTLSALPFDLDFLLAAGPSLDGAARVADWIASAPIPLSIRLCRIILEIPTFSEQLPPELDRTLEDLRASCMRVSILGDPEVCSHGALLRVRPDYLTLPAPLVKGLRTDPDHYMVVESLVQLAARLGTQVIGEGVQTETDVATLRDLGVQFAAGPRYSGPWLPADLADWRPRLAEASDPEPGNPAERTET